MHASTVAVAPDVEEMSPQEGREMLRRQVSDRLGPTLEDFLARVDDGEYDDTNDDSVLRLVMLVPFAA